MGISVSLFFIWEFVQSEFVANLLSKNITQVTKEKLELDVKFERIEFKLFPPSASFKNIKVNSLKTDYLLRSELTSLAVQFNLIDMFQTKLTISKLSLEDGRVFFRSRNQKNEELDESNSKEEFNFNQDFIKEGLKLIREKSPVEVKEVVLDKINLNVEGRKVVSHKASIKLGDSWVDYNLEFRGFDLGRIKVLEEIVDVLELRGRIDDEKIKLNLIKIEKNLNRVEYKGEISNYKNLEKIEYNLSGKLDIQIKEIHNYVDIEKIGKINQGRLIGSLIVSGKGKNYSLENKFEIENFESSFLSGDKILIESEANTKNIILKKFIYTNNEEKIELLNKFEFYNFEKKKFIEDQVSVEARNLELNTALKYLEKTLKPIRGKLDGKIDFVLNEKDFKFVIHKNTTINSFEFKYDDAKPIVQAKKIRLNEANINVIGSDVKMLFDIELEKSKFILVGEIIENNVSFKSKNMKISLEELGPMSGFELFGEGTAELDVYLSNKKSYIKIPNKFKNFSFEGYRFQEMSSEFELDLLKSKLMLKQLKGKYNQSQVSADATINLNDLSLKAHARQEKFLIKDLKEMYAPIFGKMEFLPEEVYGDWSTEIDVSGKVNLEELIINGKFFGKNNLIYNESFDALSFDYNLKKNNLSFENLVAQKTSGKLHGGFSYNLIDSNMKFWGSLSHISLKEINNYGQLPLSLNGKLNGIIKGEFSNKGNILESELYLSDSKIINRPIDDSYIKILLNQNKMNIRSSLFGDSFKINSTVNMKPLNQEKDSKINIDVNINNMNELLGVFSFVDEVSNDFKGELAMSSSLEFNLNDIKHSNYKLNIKKMKLTKSNIELDYENKLNEQISILEGKIEKWNIDIRGNNIYVISNGEGNIFSKYDITTKTKVDASLLEVLNVLISKASGTIVTKINNFNNGEIEDYTATVVSSDLELSSDFMPLVLTKGNMLLRYKKKLIYLERFFAQLNSGSLQIDGTVDLNRIVPDINMRYEFKNAGLTILKKSNLLFSGKGSLVGKTIPYTLGGDISLLKLNILNEITDFVGGDEITKTDIKYLPKNITKGLDQFLNLNININTLEPIKITNSMANIGFTGGFLVTGGERDPRLSGKLSLASMKNQVFFKNNIFNFTKGNIYFYPKNTISNPEIDFQAESSINDYKIFIKVVGPVDDFQLDLLSQPTLAKGDILSLVAFGFTENLSSNLSDAEKESMTKAGVGSIIFDRFKINETLKNEFGLQVNLGTEITQQEGSYLSQRNSTDSNLGRVRSATKIEIKKQLSDAMNLSVSSTVGSSTGQRQRMNLNYNIDKNFSVDGVYENRTDTESETTNEDTSLGADVKIRWSFK